eukprot:TRINITY_DN3903_c2_g2_i1.p1 TRINITY_DN3903_c2_g2~~TRINITY_DN3903_c2_g2_i1.p1  ORF type:complete len:381 (-),score=59.98 TRINITY_DN3903_c2_g2_i1:4-1146(-)
MAEASKPYALQPPAIVSIATTYPDDRVLEQQQRYAALSEAFEKEYGVSPSFFARAPGRVNLIGEHTDYSGYPCLPMALETHDAVIAVAIATPLTHARPTDTTSTTSPRVHISNINTRFPSGCFSALPGDIVFPRASGNVPPWYILVEAAYKGAIEHAKPPSTLPLCLMLDGCVPQGSGLSSSSSIVCAATLATLHAHQITMSRTEYATLCALSETFIGVESGGMDQAISFLGQRDEASLIEFFPLRPNEVQLPPGLSFVVADSLVEHKLQSATAGASYNVRVVECRLAALLLAHALGVDLQLDMLDGGYGSGSDGGGGGCGGGEGCGAGGGCSSCGGCGGGGERGMRLKGCGVGDGLSLSELATAAMKQLKDVKYFVWEV